MWHAHALIYRILNPLYPDQTRCGAGALPAPPGHQRPVITLIERLPTAVATMLLHVVLTLPPVVPTEPLATMLVPLTLAVTEAMLYCTLEIDALAVLRPGARALTTTVLLAELPYATEVS